MTGVWEGADLLEPISANAPCGDNLEDTALLASFDTFLVFGQSMPLEMRVDQQGKALPSPDWAEIRGRALETLARSKDLRVLAYLGTALLKIEGLPAFTTTLRVAATWLETWGNEVFPLVDEDAILRRNALSCFADPMAVVDTVRRTPLVRSRQHGTVTLRSLDIAAGTIAPAAGETPVDDAQIAAAFADISAEDLDRLHASVAAGVAALKRIEAAMAAASGAEAVPAFDGLSAQLTKAERALSAQAGARSSSAADSIAGESGHRRGASDGVADSGAVTVGAIRSRQDAIRALDAVATFFRNNEPSSPVPLFVERAKRLVSKDFLEVLADIAPEGLPQARSAGGLREE